MLSREFGLHLFFKWQPFELFYICLCLYLCVYLYYIKLFWQQFLFGLQTWGPRWQIWNFFCLQTTCSRRIGFRELLEISNIKTYKGPFGVSVSWLPNQMISLILIFGFLCRSSSWWLWPHIGVCRLLWPLLRAWMWDFGPVFRELYFLWVW